MTLIRKILADDAEIQRHADAYKLDDVRNALRRGDMKTATQIARVYSLTPVEA